MNGFRIKSLMRKDSLLSLSQSQLGAFCTLHICFKITVKQLRKKSLIYLILISASSNAAFLFNSKLRFFI